MALNISAWSIRNPIPPIVMMTAIVGLGWINFNKMPITRMPNVDIPVVAVMIAQFGASPGELEGQVTKKVEDAIAGVAGVHHIISAVSDGISQTSILFRFGTDTDRALNDVKDAVTAIKGDLPRSISDPQIQRFEGSELPILTYAAIAPGKTPEELSNFVADVVVHDLQGIRGVGKVDPIGSVQREIRVGLDPVRLQAVGLTAVQVSRQLNGINADLASGRAEIGGRDQPIRALAGAKNLAELRATRIPLPAGGEVRLDDLGLVTDTIAVPRNFARFDGKSVVGVTIKRAKGFSDVVVERAVTDKVKEISGKHPEVELKLINSSVNFTVGNYESAMHSLYEGAILTIIVVFLFLRDWRSTVIAAITLPLSILPAFWVMNMLGFSLNIVTLLAITLSVGILVDDAIVEIENIVRHIQMGKSPYQAALEAADEIGMAVVAISLTIVAVFLPVSFLASIPGQYFKQFGITVSVQVLFSLLVARLITPMLAAYFLKSHGQHEPPPGLVMRGYLAMLRWSLRHWFHRLIVFFVGLLTFFAAMAAGGSLPSGFMPASDTSRSVLVVDLPPGSQLGDTDTATESVSKLLRGRSEIVSIFVQGGRLPSGVVDVGKAALTITYQPAGKRSLSQKQLEQAISRDLSNIPDIRFWFLDEVTGARNFTVTIAGADNAMVANVAADLAGQMQRLKSVTNVVSNAALSRPELRIYPRRELAVRLGVSTESLSETIRVATIGDVGPALAKFNAGDRSVPIRVLLEEDARADRQVLEQIRVPSQRPGVLVPLVALADMSFGEAASSINRYDRERMAQVEADIADGYSLSDAVAAVKALPVIQNLPPGIRFSPGGDVELQTELNAEFGVAMGNGLMAVYIVLAILFNSMLHPLTILFSLPLSVTGAMLALVVTHSAITLPVMIGILMLMGIVTKNAIMLIDFAIEGIHRGMDRTAALVDAGAKRARPIVMTTIAMVAGMLPSLMGWGAGGEFRSPMAITVVGGLLVSTLLSLLFVPAFYIIMDDIGWLLGRVFGRFVGKADEGPPTDGTPTQGTPTQSTPTQGTQTHGTPIPEPLAGSQPVAAAHPS